MLTYEEALKKIVDTVETGPVEERPLTHILDHVSASAIEATFDLPRFDNSAMDGYGILSTDTDNASELEPRELALVGTIEAGARELPSIGPGKAVKIFTGARVPPSVTGVVMREYCQEKNGSVLVMQNTAPGANIRRAGEEFKEGEEVLPPGIKVTPPVIGLLASFGHRKFPVYSMPKVSIIGTGNELVEPGQSLDEAQIYDSNTYALAAAIQALGMERPARVHAGDTKEEIKNALEEALNYSDVIITTGGVSVGDRDLVKEVLESDLSVETIFWRARVKPGKPVYFGKLKMDGKPRYIFGLPGNPVSALVTFHLFVKPALAKFQGLVPETQSKTKAFVQSNRKKKPGRLDFVRGILNHRDDGSLAVSPTAGQDSHMLSGLAKADCLIEFAQDDAEINAGDLVNVQFLNWHELN